MTTRMIFSIAVVALAIGFAASPSHADVLRVTPSVTSVLPDGPGGESRVILKFNLSGLRAGDNRVIRAAVLDWDLSGISDGEESTFQAYAVTSSWTLAGIGGGSIPTIDEEPTSEWQVGPADYAKTGGFTRLNLKPLASDWASGQGTNYGVVVSTSALSNESLASQVGNATLVVFYTFAR